MGGEHRAHPQRRCNQPTTTAANSLDSGLLDDLPERVERQQDFSLQRQIELLEVHCNSGDNVEHAADAG